MFFPHHNVYSPSQLKFYNFASDILCDDDDMTDAKVSQYRPNSYIHKDDDQEVELVIDLPGVKANDLDVQVKDRILSISGTRFISSSKTLKFARQFQLDTTNIDPNTIKANLTDGMLTITVQKVKKLDGLMKIAITTNPRTNVTVEEEEEEKNKEDVENEIVMVETTNDAEAS